MTAIKTSLPIDQKGATLIISLLVLILLTLLGIGSMRTTVFEEQMAGVERDRELAFQAAEAALSFGEQFILLNKDAAIGSETWLEHLANTRTALCASTEATYPLLQGTCGPQVSGAPLDPYATAIWDSFARNMTTNLQIRKTGSTAENYAKNAKFFIELIRFDAVTGNYYFRVTAKGYGGDTAAEVMLQSVFAI